MSLNDLIAQRDELACKQAELSKAIAEAQSEARKIVVAQIRSLMADHGLTVNDLVITTSSRKGSKGDGHGNAGGKVAPKYRNLATGDTWTGRGLKPNWLKAAIEAGHSIDEFTIWDRLRIRNLKHASYPLAIGRSGRNLPLPTLVSRQT